jgi:hypothetical protein
VPERKITGYLLAEDHPEGWSKAAFLARFGFTFEAWPVLEVALLSHARDGRVLRKLSSPYGRKYEVEGPLVAPDGRRPRVITVWLIEAGEARPRFVSLNPSKRRSGGND